jgi:hypothetical protein
MTVALMLSVTHRKRPASTESSARRPSEPPNLIVEGVGHYRPRAEAAILGSMSRRTSMALVLVICAGACTTEPPAPSSPAAFSSTTTLPPATATTVASTTTTVSDPRPAVRAPEVAGAPAPVIDGTIGDDEWAGAAAVAMDDGTEARFLQSGGYVYVAIAATEIGAANLLVAGGDVVRVLHSSAALGSARYEPDLGGWTLTQDFDWCCRNVADDAERTALLAREGWQANIGYAGTSGHVEYQVLIEDGSPVALSYVLRDGTVAVWPADLDEAARRPLYGQREETESFDFDGWATLRTRLDG